MAYSKNHSPINWRNYPSTSTPINETNLNKMDSEIGVNDDRIVALSVDKADATEVNTALNGKVDKVTGKGLSTNDYTTAEKTKLSGISANAKNVSITQVVTTGDTLANITIDGTTTAIKAKKITVDDMLSSTSENPVQNKIIYEALNNILPEETAEGNPISITDASGLSAKSCEVTMNPIQDLHGYDHPWAGGNWKNKLDKADSFASANSNWLNVDCNLPAGTYTFSFKSSTTSGQCTFNVFDSNGDRIYQAPNSIQLASITTHTFTISSAGARVSSYINVASNISEVMIEEGSSKTDFAPYSNICPISGRDSVNVVVTGKNLIDQSSITKLIRNGAETSSGITNSDGEITVTYTYGNQGSYSLSQIVPIYSGEITISADFMIVSSSGSAQIRTNVGNNTSSISATPTPNKTITLSALNTWENRSVTYALNEKASDGITITLQASASGQQLKIKNLQVEIGSTATGYEKYRGNTKTITFPSTIYGGTDEVVGGTGVSNMLLFDLGSKTWTRSTSYKNPFFYANLTNAELSIKENNGICENYTKFAITRVDGAVFGNNAPNNTFATNTTNGNQIFIRDDNYTSASDFKTAMSGVKLCYELATPTPFSTEPTPIELLKGTNVVSTDGDKFYLTYTADIKSYIDGKLAELQS